MIGVDILLKLLVLAGILFIGGICIVLSFIVTAVVLMILCSVITGLWGLAKDTWLCIKDFFS